MTRHKFGLNIYRQWIKKKTLEKVGDFLLIHLWRVRKVKFFLITDLFMGSVVSDEDICIGLNKPYNTKTEICCRFSIEQRFSADRQELDCCYSKYDRSIRNRYRYTVSLQKKSNTTCRFVVKTIK
jgi:hypothetical protein